MIERPIVYTIGHSVHPMDGFLDLLEAYMVELVVDIRSAPRSGFAPQFNQSNLSGALSGRGVRYLFMGRELGGRPNGQHLTSLTDKMAAYSQIRATPAFDDGLARIREEADTTDVAVMCSEEDPSSCHRHLLVAPALEDLGLAVVHIRADGASISESELMLQHSERALRIMGRQLSFLADP